MERTEGILRPLADHLLARGVALATETQDMLPECFLRCEVSQNAFPRVNNAAIYLVLTTPEGVHYLLIVIARSCSGGDDNVPRAKRCVG